MTRQFQYVATPGCGHFNKTMKRGYPRPSQEDLVPYAPCYDLGLLYNTIDSTTKHFKNFINSNYELHKYNYNFTIEKICLHVHLHLSTVNENKPPFQQETGIQQEAGTSTTISKNTTSRTSQMLVTSRISLPVCHAKQTNKQTNKQTKKRGHNTIYRRRNPSQDKSKPTFKANYRWIRQTAQQTNKQTTP